MGKWAKTLSQIAVATLVLACSVVTVSPAQAGSSTFYLNAKPGCYSFTVPAEDAYPIEGSRYKLLFRTSCDAEHHIQVLYSGVLKTKGGVTATENQVYKACASYYKKVIGSNPPTVIQNSKPYLRYWWPDAGLETLKYNNKIICYVHAADKTYTNYDLLMGGF